MESILAKYIADKGRDRFEKEGDRIHFPRVKVETIHSTELSNGNSFSYEKEVRLHLAFQSSIYTNEELARLIEE